MNYLLNTNIDLPHINKKYYILNNRTYKILNYNKEFYMFCYLVYNIFY